MSLAIIIIYVIALVLILVYSLMQLNLVINYLRSHKSTDEDIKISSPDELPIVTIQLPVFNELYVVERLINSVVSIDYPKEKLEIQVLDDSNDETSDIIKNKLSQLDKHIDIKHIQRENRKGFKAGALQEGLDICKGEFVAIFDADFIPSKDFLFNTLPHFEDKNVGVVQTKWGHINKDYSVLTKIQAFGLNAHFSIEQVGRNFGGHYINFNGTAGVWRKECIYDAGGWEHDTLTEDLDLSYRSQMKGWKFKYLEDVESPAELPVVISAIRNQQFRWNKGGAENFRKMSKRLVSEKDIPFKTRVHGMFHLFNSSVFLFIFIVSVLSIPILHIKNISTEYAYLFEFSSIFLISTFILLIYYWMSHKKIKEKNFFRFVVKFFVFLCFSMGLSFHNTIAVIEGYMGKKSSFVRTPKFNVSANKDKWLNNKYVETKIGLPEIIEGFLCLYFIYGITLAFYYNDFGLLPLHVMLLFGFGSIFTLSVLQAKPK